MSFAHHVISLQSHFCTVWSYCALYDILCTFMNFVVVLVAGEIRTGAWADSVQQCSPRLRSRDGSGCIPSRVSISAVLYRVNCLTMDCYCRFNKLLSISQCLDLFVHLDADGNNETLRSGPRAVTFASILMCLIRDLHYYSKN